MYAVRLEFPEGYYLVARRNSYEAHLDGYGMVAGGFECEADAIFAAQEHDEKVKAEEREAAENAAEWSADSDLPVAA